MCCLTPTDDVFAICNILSTGEGPYRLKFEACSPAWRDWELLTRCTMHLHDFQRADVWLGHLHRKFRNAKTAMKVSTSAYGDVLLYAIQQRLLLHPKDQRMRPSSVHYCIRRRSWMYRYALQVHVLTGAVMYNSIVRKRGHRMLVLRRAALPAAGMRATGPGIKPAA